MLFNSYEYILLFLPIVYFVYILINYANFPSASKVFLVLSSLYFYGRWNPVYLPLIISSMVFNYQTGKALIANMHEKSQQRKMVLAAGVFTNIALLAYFKYFDFFILNFNLITGSKLDFLNITLPLAISFFTFQQIAYLVDSYSNETKEYNFLNYSLFVTFFPQLIAGPIVHHKEMMPQFANSKNWRVDLRNISLGILLFYIGLFKKVVIADSLSPTVASGFDTAGYLTFFEAWITSLSYTFQLYFDFSGYTDMAIGSALIFNIKLPINFNSPYKSINIQDFWRNWHITLSRFLRDYVYIPLGGNRSSKLKVSFNLMATFVLGGIWHGAGWTFIFWGFLHGAALVIQRFWKDIGFKIPSLISWFITFNFVNVAWVFFRATSWEDALKVLSGMFGGSGVVFPQGLRDYISNINFLEITYGEVFESITFSSVTATLVAFCFILTLFFRNSHQIINSFKPNWFYLIFAALLTFFSMGLVGADSEFLYFNF